jgi:branched-chain amino acid transport system ATP-binding protein
MACPTLLMIDEPFLGLAPQVVAQISQVITRLNRKRGLTIVFIEQNVELALGRISGVACRLAHRGYVLESGQCLRGAVRGPAPVHGRKAHLPRGLACWPHAMMIGSD